MSDYYTEKLSAERLKKCYDLASPRVRQYLQAEIDFVAGHISPGFQVLELGCGYGRVMKYMAPGAGLLFGIDTSPSNLKMGKEYLSDFKNCHLICADAACPPINAESLDLVVCIQNGISAFQIDHVTLVRNACGLLKSGGKAFFSTYSENFWSERLEWFRVQAAHGLVGEINEAATGQGVIICKDGFRAETVSPEEFIRIASLMAVRFEITEIDNSSLFCVIEKP